MFDLTGLPNWDERARKCGAAWGPFEDCMAKVRDGYEMGEQYKSWDAFAKLYVGMPEGLNVVVDAVFCEHYADDEDEEPSSIDLNLWMTHPRKSASKGIAIHNITEGDIAAIRAYLASSWEIIKLRFAWLEGD